MMSIKNLNTITSLLLLLLLSKVSVSVNAANANSFGAKERYQSTEYAAEQEKYLLSQALGHSDKNGAQMSWDDYTIGRIVNKAGEQAFILMEDGITFQQEAPLVYQGQRGAVAGEDVLIVNKDGKNVVIDIAHPAWIQTLIEDYNFSIENDKKSDPPLEERTAPLWQQLGIRR